MELLLTSLGLGMVVSAALVCGSSAPASPAMSGGAGAAPARAPAPDASAPPLVIPPPPAIPGEHALPEEEELEGEDEAEYQARLAAAAASPRRSNFSVHRGVPRGPEVPAASVRQRQRVTLTPTEAGVADRNAMSESLRVMPFEMRQPSGFSTVYEVDLRPDVLVRGNGAVYAVFPQGDYAIATVRKQRVVQTLVPAGTMYYIGEPDWRRVWLPGIRGMMPRLRRETPEEYAARTPPATARERVEPTMPVDCHGVYVRPVLAEEITGLGPLSHRIDTFIAAPLRAFDAPPPAVPLRRGPAPEAPEAERRAAEARDADDGRAEPPLHADPRYRRERVRQLMERAAQSRSAS